MNGPCTTIRQYRDRDQDLQGKDDAELEAAREADSFSFGPRHELTNTRLGVAMHTCPECGQACSCNGDIDDLLDLDEEGSDNCVHYEECQEDDQFYDGWIEPPDMGAQ